jgi:hypothetical protein
MLPPDLNEIFSFATDAESVEIFIISDDDPAFNM